MAKAAAARAQQTPTRFAMAKTGKGYVTTDTKTGLEWSHTLGKVENHAGCKALIDELNAANHGEHADWRLPTHDELQTIAVRAPGGTFAVADKDAFPAAAADWYWSSTPSPGIPEASRGVSFGRMAAAWQPNKAPGHVRAVRGTLKAA